MFLYNCIGEVKLLNSVLIIVCIKVSHKSHYVYRRRNCGNKTKAAIPRVCDYGVHLAE